MKKHLTIGALIALVLISSVRASYHTEPAYEGRRPELVTYDASRHVYVDRYKIPIDNVFIAGRLDDPEFYRRLVEHHNGPRDIPATNKLVLTISANNLALRVPSGASHRARKKRFVLINPELAINELPGDTANYRAWPHLGLLYVGTAAHEEGYKVILWDELVQGFAPMEKLVKVGDIVGLSLVSTGMERAELLARRAKELGARYVIAGNDSAAFRANKLLAFAGKPVDAVFTGNSLTTIRQFFRQVDKVPLNALRISGLQTEPGAVELSNIDTCLKEELVQLAIQKKGDPDRFKNHDVFMVPKFDLFSHSYWEQVWSNYRRTFGHKYHDQTTLKNACALFAQGCTRTRGHCVCTYCTIRGVADIRIPDSEMIVRMAEAFKRFGINVLYNTTDSVYEMAPEVVPALQRVSPWEALTIYGRAQGVAQHPEYLDLWHSLAPKRLVINMGQDSGSEQVLSCGVNKSSQKSGSRVGENRRAVEYIARSGTFMHASFIFGSPGETHETCESTMAHISWMAGVLGRQFDTCESDIYWLNFGSPASEIFYNYNKAREFAALAGKDITEKEWIRDFASHRDALIVPEVSQRAWYNHFTHISLDEARAYTKRVDALMKKIEGSVASRAFNPKEPRET